MGNELEGGNELGRSGEVDGHESNRSDSWEDWWKNWWDDDTLDTLGWGGAIIWAGIVLLIDTTGISENLDWWEGWPIFFIGVGVLVLLGTGIRIVIPRFRRKVVPSLIFGIFLLAMGLGDLENWGWIWAIFLFALAGAILVSAFRNR